MRKKILYLFIFFLVFFSNVKVISAASIDCGNQQKMITDYEYYDKKQNEVCADLSNEENTVSCNNSKLQKNLLIADFMKLDEENEVCSEVEEKVNKIIDANKDNCTRILNQGFSDYVNKIMVAFYILGPVLLIIFGSIDYAKATAAGSEEELRKANKNFAKRVAATILLFLTPVITNFIISLNVSDYYLSGNAYSCNYNFTVFNNVRKIGLIQIQRKNKYTSSDFNPTIGGITTDEQAEALTQQFNTMLNTKIHYDYEYQNGPFPKWWTSPYNRLSPFQCTWWANGRASQYLTQYGTKYKEYPTQYGDGGEYYDVNASRKYFKYGQSPRPNSIISWSNGSAGHVAYVEGVSSDGIYISHAGGGRRWFGVDKIDLDGSLSSLGWSGYKLNGYIYLDEPIQ